MWQLRRQLLTTQQQPGKQREVQSQLQWRKHQLWRQLRQAVPKERRGQRQQRGQQPRKKKQGWKQQKQKQRKQMHREGH